MSDAPKNLRRLENRASEIRAMSYLRCSLVTILYLT